jgi:hypothetical protein
LPPDPAVTADAEHFSLKYVLALENVEYIDLAGHLVFIGGHGDDDTFALVSVGEHE